MAQPNYGFEKRQRELAKKRKKEEKLKRKAEAAAAPPEGTEEAESTEGQEAGAPRQETEG